MHQIRAMVDTGAHRTVISRKTLEKIQYTVGQPRNRRYVGATDHELQLGPNYVNFKIVIKNKKFPIVNALVENSKPDGQMLIGQADLQNLNATLYEGDGKMTIGRSNRITVQRYTQKEIKRNASISMVKSKNELDSATTNENEDQPIRDWTTTATIADTCHMGGDRENWEGTIPEPSETCKGCPSCSTDKNRIQNEDYAMIDDSKLALKIMCQKIRQKMHNTYTHDKVNITEAGEKRYPWAAKKLREINEKYKDNFAASIGDAGPEFICNCEIKGDFATKRLAGQQPYVGNQKDAIKKQMIELIANGVLVPADELGVTPKYFITLMPRAKTDDDGVQYDPMVALRIVNDCTKVNQLASYPGCSVDRIDECVDWAVRASRHGLNCKSDISQCYFCIRIHPDLYPYLCVNVPDMGVFVFVRLPQGWSYSAQFTVTVLKRIFWKFGNNLQRYLDDIFISMENSNSELEFVQLYESFMKTLRRYNLRIKGQKTFLLCMSFNFLGYRIAEGKLGPNPHLVNKLLNIKYTDLKTVKALLALIGMARYLAKFMRKSTHVMHGLTQAVRNRKTNEIIEWDDKLIDSFELVKDALRELTKTHPLESDLQTIIAVDTSAIATGGMIYQINENGQPQICAFFSRSRKDKERKLQISSCHMELYGLVILLEAFRPWLMQMKNVITVITDSHSLVKLYRKFKQNMCPSSDMRLNNCLYELRHYNLNIMHASNKSAVMLQPDFVSRMGYSPKTVEKGLCKDEPGIAKCAICKLAELPMENPKVFNEAVGRLSAMIASEPWIPQRESKIFQIQKDKQLVPIGQLKKKNISLKELINNGNLIACLQKTDKVYRDIIDCLENGRTNFPRKHARAETIRMNRKPKLVNGALNLNKFIDGVETRIYPLPKEAAWVAIHAVHLEVGHRAPTQMVKQVSRYFEFENMKKLVDLYLEKCIPCTLMRREAKFTREKQKPVKMINSLFKQILVDEIHRMRGKESHKILVAIEAISQFMLSIPTSDKPNSDEFIAKMLLVKTLLAPHASEEVEIQIRCDNAPWHKSQKVRETLNRLNIKVVLHESSSFSKNNVPELDSKIRQFSEHLHHYITTTQLEMSWACQLATSKCNTTVGKMNRTPAELFTGFDPVSMKSLNLDVGEYIKEIARVRQMKRESADRKVFKQNQNKKKSETPYENPKLNDPLMNSKIDFSKIRTGDLVKLNVDFDKNSNKMNLLEVKSINYKEKLAQLVPTGVKNPTTKRVSFERIVRHIPTDRVGNINMTNLYRPDTMGRTGPKKKNTISETEYLISEEEIYDLTDVQIKLTNLISKSIPALIPDPLYEGDLTESTIAQEVPEMPTLDLERLFQEDQSTITMKKEETKMDQSTMNESKLDGSKMDQTLNQSTMPLYCSEDSDEFEHVTVEQLSSLTNLNQATYDPNDSTVETPNSSYNVPSFGMNESYENDFNTARTFEDDYEIINSTQTEATVPDLEINERPIRNRRAPDYYQSN